MKRIVPINLWLLLLIITFACSDFEPIQSQDHTEVPSTVVYRTLEEALEAADEWFEQMEQPTRANGRQVKSVECLQSGTSTRSNAADTLLYLVNYEDEQGFALLGAPVASKQIYAISEEGRLLMSDTIDIKPLAMFLDNARQDAQNASIINPPGIDPYPYGTRIVRKVDPMLPGKVAQWSQEYPYNFFCPIVGGHRGLVGCGAVSVGMLMAYYQHPDTIGVIPVNWKTLIEINPGFEISRILEQLAGPRYLNSVYVDDNWQNRSTSILKIKVPFTLMKYSVGYAWNCLPYAGHSEEILDFMKNGYEGIAEAAPVIMFGAGLTNGVPDSNKGHFWVMDGYIERERYLIYNPELPGIKAPPTLHMVWGWGGRANGYYTYLSSSNALSPIPSDELLPNMPAQFGELNVFGRYIIFNKK